MFWLVPSRFSSELLPGSGGIPQAAVIAFVVSVIATALQTIILMLHGHPVFGQRVLVPGHRIVLATSQADGVITAITWLAVAAS